MAGGVMAGGVMAGGVMAGGVIAGGVIRSLSRPDLEPEAQAVSPLTLVQAEGQERWPARSAQ
jgi:hypothetical protein